MLRLSLLSAVVLIISCQVKEERSIEVSRDLIEKEQFTAMMVDMFLIEGLRSMHTTKEHKELNPTEVYYNGLWEKTQVSQERFTKSFDYYRTDRVTIQKIYEEVAKRIKEKERLMEAMDIDTLNSKRDTLQSVVE